MRIIGSLIIALMLAGPLGVAPASAAPGNVAYQLAPSSTATTTDRLNLRSGPSLGDSVTTVMPAGASVTLSGQAIDGFVFVTWNGEKGWASRDYLRISSPPPSQSTQATTTDRLNLRSGPSLADGVIAVLPRGAKITLAGKAQNGFSAVSWNGRTGWAFTTYLSQEAPPPTPTTTATTTDRLNLRSGPSLADGIRAVLPGGAVVTVTGATSNGFRPVVWNGYEGWAYAQFLTTGTASAPGPAPAPAPEPAPNGVTTDALNLRSGPGSSYPVLTVMPRGAKIALTGKTSNGYTSVSWEGRSGWAHSDWIAADGAVPVPRKTGRTTDTLNLRSGPATTYTVLAVLPASATVTLTGQTSNGFHAVSWNGKEGWAFSAYLDTGDTPAPVPEPEPQPAPAPDPDGIPFDVTNAIAGPTRGSANEAIALARRAGSKRIGEVEAYIREVYRLAPQIGFDPALIVSQSALETGYWKSDQWNDNLNPAGLGITGQPDQVSSLFPSGTVSARAQLAHMHAEVFGDTRPLPAALQGVDPTYQNVFRAGWAGTVRTLDDLAGTWAIDPEYASKIVRVAGEIFKG